MSNDTDPACCGSDAGRCCIFAKSLLAQAARMVGKAIERHGRLTELPWDVLVAELVAWQPRRRCAPVVQIK